MAPLSFGTSIADSVQKQSPTDSHQHRQGPAMTMTNVSILGIRVRRLVLLSLPSASSSEWWPHGPHHYHVQHVIGGGAVLDDTKRCGWTRCAADLSVQPLLVLYCDHPEYILFNGRQTARQAGRQLGRQADRQTINKYIYNITYNIIYIIYNNIYIYIYICAHMYT